MWRHDTVVERQSAGRPQRWARELIGGIGVVCGFDL
jgi:hypothetical protein